MAKRLLVIVGIMILLAGVANIPFGGHRQSVFSVGFVGTAYAATPDKLVGYGNDSDVIQLLLDGLPSWGGRIELWVGDSSDHYQFSYTPMRAIPNVCIEGAGYGVYVAGNDSMPLFDDGGQSNWVFKNFRTDAGGITRTGTGSMVLGCWLDGVYTDDVYLMKAASFGGDVSGNYTDIAVTNDSHSHTGSTLSGIDVSDDTNLAASAPITLSGDTVGIDTSTFVMWADSLGGDVTGNSSATVVGDDSHAHTSATVSGLDISDDTNLAVASPITLTEDTIGVGNATSSLSGVVSPASSDFAMSGSTLTLSRQRNLNLTAGGGSPSTTSGCAYPSQIELTSGIDVWVADFDASADESMQWAFMWPDEYGADGVYTITATFEWTVASGSGNVTWGIQGGSWGDNEAATLGTAGWVNDAAQTANRPFFTASTSAVTLSGTPAAGEHGQIKVLRDADNSEGLGDDLSVDARLISVKVVFHAK